MKRLFLPDLLSLGFCLPGPGPRFAIARASHVSFQRFCVTTTLPKYMLMERFSFAIWNKNKGIVVTVATIWVTNVTLLLLGEFSLYLRHVEPQRTFLLSGVVRVNDLVQSFGVFALS